VICPALGEPTTSLYHQPQQNSDAANRMEMLTAAAEMSRALASIQSEMQQMQDCVGNKDTTHKESIPCLTSQQMHVDQAPCHSNPMQSEMHNAEHAINSKFHELLTEDMMPKITLSGARQLLDSALMGVQQKSEEGTEKRGQKRTASNRSTPNEGKEQDRRKR